MLTSFGSNNCFSTKMKKYKPKIEIAREVFLFKNKIIDHGTIIPPAPRIGSASKKPIKIAISIGYSISIPTR